MELNSLNIPETNRRDLQRLLDQAYAGYVADLDALADEAADAIEAQYRSNPLFMRDVVEDYSRQSAQLADDYFSQLRAIWAEQSGVDLPEFEHPDLLDPSEVLYRMNGGFSGTDWNGLNYSDLVAGRSNAGLSVDSLWPELKTIDDWQQLIGDMVSTSARLMTMRDMYADPTKPKWARVPRGSDPCAFCVMLATRGFEYLSEETADFGPTFHNGHCHCDVISSWGRQKLKGFDPDGMSERWEQCKTAIEHRLTHDEYLRTRSSPGQKFGNWKRNQILAEMRWRDREWLHSGAEPLISFPSDGMREETEKARPQEIRTAQRLRGHGIVPAFQIDHREAKDPDTGRMLLIGLSDLEGGIELKTPQSADKFRTIDGYMGSASKKPDCRRLIIDNSENDNMSDEELIGNIMKSHRFKNGIVYILNKKGQLLRIK